MHPLGNREVRHLQRLADAQRADVRLDRGRDVLREDTRPAGSTDGARPRRPRGRRASRPTMWTGTSTVMVSSRAMRRKSTCSSTSRMLSRWTSRGMASHSSLPTLRSTSTFMPASVCSRWIEVPRVDVDGDGVAVPVHDAGHAPGGAELPRDALAAVRALLGLQLAFHASSSRFLGMSRRPYSGRRKADAHCSDRPEGTRPNERKPQVGPLTLEHMFGMVAVPPPETSSPCEVLGCRFESLKQTACPRSSGAPTKLTLRCVRSQRELFAVIAEIDRNGLWKRDGAHDMAHWLWMRYGLSDWKASRWLAAAHALESLPLIDQRSSRRTSRGGQGRGALPVRDSRDRGDARRVGAASLRGSDPVPG